MVYRQYNVNEGLPSSQVYTTLQDKKGYMWFSTDRGVTRFNGYSFEHFATETGDGRNAVFRMQEDYKNRLWSIVLYRQLYYFEDNNFIPFKYNAIIDTLVNSTHMHFCQIDRENTLWFAYANVEKPVVRGIDSLGNLKTITNLDEVPIAFENLWKGSVKQICQQIDYEADSVDLEKEKKVLKRQLLFDIPPDETDSIRYFRRFYLWQNKLSGYDYQNGLQSFEFPSNASGAMFVDRNNNLWICVPSTGAYCFEGGDLSAEPKIYLPGESVASVYEDHEGGLWFTTLYDGIFYLNNAFSEVYSRNSGLPNNHVTCVLRMKNKLYCGHSEGQLSELEENNGDFTFKKAYSGFTHVFRLEQTGEDRVTVLSGRQGTELPENFVSLLNRCFYNRNDTTYLFNRRGHFHVISPTGDTLRTVTSVPEGKRSMSYSEKYGLLLGTNFGLYYLDDSVFVSLKDVHPLFGERIQRIRSFQSEWQIICTLGKGLIFWSDDIIFRLSKSQGLNSNLCNDMYVQNDSTIWVCSNLGINEVCFYPQKNSLKVKRSLTLENGLLSNEVRSLYIDTSDVWAVTSQGLNRLPLFSLKENLEAPPIYISKAMLGKYEVSNKASVAHTQNTFQISYVGLSYKWPRQLKYRYRLLGSEDENWKTTHQINLIYSSLESGNYRFEVEAINPSGVSSLRPAVLEFTINTPFWRASWFLILVGGIIAFILLLANWQNIRRIKKRTRLLQELNEYKHKALRAQMNPHFIYNSLNTVQSFILKNDSTQSMSYLAKFSRLMRMTFKNAGNNIVSLGEDLNALQLYTDLEMMRYPNRMEVIYHLNVPDVNKVLIPPLLIQPFVENAILHGVLPKESKGTIFISIGVMNENLHVEVKDDGVGMDVSAAIQARKKWNQVHGNQEGMSIDKNESGISVTKSRIRLFNFQNKNKNMDVKFNKPMEGGTTVSFVLALIHKEND